MSKLLYGVETWVVSDDRTVSHYPAVLRLLLPVHPDRHLHDDEILSETGILQPLGLIRRSRLRYVATLLHCGRRHEWGLLHADAAWTSLVEEDTVWMWDNLHHCSTLPDPRNHWPVWEELIISHRSYWRKLVRSVCEHSVLQTTSRWKVREFFADFTNILRHRFEYDRALTSSSSPVMTLGCLPCRKRCKSRAGEAAHMFKVRHQAARRRQLVDGNVCAACLKDFHTAEKLMAPVLWQDLSQASVQQKLCMS